MDMESIETGEHWLRWAERQGYDNDKFLVDGDFCDVILERPYKILIHGHF